MENCKYSMNNACANGSIKREFRGQIFVSKSTHFFHFLTISCIFLHFLTLFDVFLHFFALFFLPILPNHYNPTPSSSFLAYNWGSVSEPAKIFPQNSQIFKKILFFCFWPCGFSQFFGHIGFSQVLTIDDLSLYLAFRVLSLEI